jgi:hypothetical protein
MRRCVGALSGAICAVGKLPSTNTSGANRYAQRTLRAQQSAGDFLHDCFAFRCRGCIGEYGDTGSIRGIDVGGGEYAVTASPMVESDRTI